MDILRKNSVKTLVLGVGSALVLMLSGCGGSDSASSSTGVFQDSEVDGLKYSSASASGTTQDGGKFTYFNGETVSFYLGDLLLGSAAGAASLTPLDIVDGANGQMTTEVVNVLRLLQTLDSDADLTNGITIPAAVESMSFTAIDFSDEAAVINLVAEIDPGLTLISADDAVAHFSETLATLGGTIDYIDYLGATRTAAATAGAAEYHTGTGYGNTMFDSAENKCQNCHNELYDTWKNSMHGKSWTDPIFQSKFQDFLRTHLAKIGSNAEYTEAKFKGVAQTCIKCHAPGAYYAGDVAVSVTPLMTNPTTADLTAAKANNQSNMSPFDPTQATTVVSASKFNNTLYQASFQIGHKANQEGINCAFCHSMETVRMMKLDGSDNGQYTLKDALREGPVGVEVHAAGTTLAYSEDGTDHDMNSFFRLWGPEKYADPANTPKTGNFDLNKSKDGRYTMHSVDLNGTGGKVHFTGGPFYGPYGVTGISNENASDETNRTAQVSTAYHKDLNNHFGGGGVGDQGKALCLSCHQRSAGAIDITSAGDPAVKDVGTDNFMELCSTWNAVTVGGDTNYEDTDSSPKCQKCHMERIEGKVLHRWADPEGNWTLANNPALTAHFDPDDTTVAAGDNPVRDGWLNSHAFLGASKTGHGAAVVAKIKSGFAATLAVTEPNNSTLEVTTTLQNKTGHMFPGAHPMRRTLTRVIVTDANGVMAPYEVTSTGASTFDTIVNTVTPLSGKTLDASQPTTVTLTDGGNAGLDFTGKAADLSGAAVGGQKFDGQSVVVIAPDGTVKSQEIVNGAIQGTLKNAAIAADSNLSTFTRIYGHETGKMLNPATGAPDLTGTFVVRPGFDSNVVPNDTRLSPNETETYTLTYDTSGGAGLTRPLTVTYKVYYMQKGANGSFPTTADGWLDPAVNTDKKLLITEVFSATETVQ